MSRYSVVPGQIDQFNRVVSFAVMCEGESPIAVCPDHAWAAKVAAALNEFEPHVEVEASPSPPDPATDYWLCPRGGDHVSGDDGHCKKCGEDLIPF